MFENRMVKRYSDTRGNKRGIEKLHSEGLYDLYCLPSVSGVTRLGRITWAVHVTSMGKKKNAYRWREESTRKT
jgi:hypothetical protein